MNRGLRWRTATPLPAPPAAARRGQGQARSGQGQARSGQAQARCMITGSRVSNPIRFDPVITDGRTMAS